MPFDPKKNETNYWVAEDEDCKKMEQKYDWQLKRFEKTSDSILPVNCIYHGQADLPPVQGDINDD